MTASVPPVTIEQYNCSIPSFVKIAFFDLDETLTDRDTDLLWALWRGRRSLRGVMEILWMFRLNARYYRGGLDADTYMAYHRFRVRGISIERLDTMAERFFAEWGVNHLSAGAPSLVRTCRDKGILPVIITAQQRFIAVPFACRLGIDEVIGNTYLSDEKGRFLRHDLPYCYREGKIPRAEGFAAGRGVTLAQCAFYSDSVNDIPLLERTGFPVAVDPDPLLMEHARKRGWPVRYLRGQNPSA